MNNEKGPLTWIKKWLQQESSSSKGENKKPSKYQYLLVVLLAGVAIMLVGNVFSSNQEGQSAQTFSDKNESEEDVPALGPKKSEDTITMSDFERMYETQIKDALDQIVGVSDAAVMVNVASTATNVYEKNQTTQEQTTEETDRQGGKRIVEDSSVDEQLVILREGDKEVPLISQTEKPEITGVLVVAKGAENIQVKQWIIEAVTRVLDVPIHRVAVLPKKSKGD
ncbi:stage III sporulation protein AG [Bacillus oleivorans]|uniref:Stage III sporulation protein AG n=1 Tax=Bacillus oleivorans TaxID=1448271 RepID=A0A285CLS1_9BACI|nr:stage III sporulation protein AG [Bacillus oleivorans]SNX67966.1 stage III sporulation protein AG [Bacillus oleivorans]